MRQAVLPERRFGRYFMGSPIPYLDLHSYIWNIYTFNGSIEELIGIAERIMSEIDSELASQKQKRRQE